MTQYNMVLRTPLIRQNVLACWLAHFATFPHYGGKVRRYAAVGASVHGKFSAKTDCSSAARGLAALRVTE